MGCMYMDKDTQYQLIYTKNNIFSTGIIMKQFMYSGGGSKESR